MMELKYKKYLPWISGVAIFFALIHLIKPTLGIDYIFLSFVLLALLPWVLPFIKSLEFPGGLKIELKEIQEAIKKTSTTLCIDNVYQQQSLTPTELKAGNKDNLALLRSVADSDPNLALVGFRIEIEKRIRELAIKNNIEADRTSLDRLVNELRIKKNLEPDMVAGLMDLIGLGHRAAHGADVEQRAAQYLLDVGPDIIAKLDKAIKN